MVTEKSAAGDKRPHVDNDRQRRKPKKMKLNKRARSGENENEEESAIDMGEEALGEDSDVSEESEVADEEAECDLDENGKCKKKKHIHPCVCDLSKKQKERIAAFLKHKKEMQIKYEKRVKEIEAELARLEEERLERERELQEQQELFGDEYEVVGKKKKRKKRSARRASMVSLGVKQVINWRKAPRIEVKPTTASSLRKKYTAYCGRIPYPPSPQKPVDFHKKPDIEIQATLTSELRSKVNISKKEYLIKTEDKRPLFQTPYYV